MSDDKIKDALHMLPYGFYAIRSRNGDDVNIMVLTWLMQAGAKNPLSSDSASTTFTPG